MAYALTRECWLDAAGVETFVSHGRADETVPLALGKTLFHRALKAGFSVLDCQQLRYPDNQVYLLVRNHIALENIGTTWGNI